MIVSFNLIPIVSDKLFERNTNVMDAMGVVDRMDVMDSITV